MVEDHGKELMALSPVDWHRDWEIELAPFSVQALALVNNDGSQPSLYPGKVNYGELLH